jgi:hypothetical protein
MLQDGLEQCAFNAMDVLQASHVTLYIVCYLIYDLILPKVLLLGTYI